MDALCAECVKGKRLMLADPSFINAFNKRNRLSPRFLTRDKDADLRKQIALLESLGVIEKSTASEYSQVHLVRKPDQSWRLSIDFKNLNDATESMETWPLPTEHSNYDRQSDAASSSSLRHVPSTHFKVQLAIKE